MNLVMLEDKSLLEREERFRRLFEQSSDAIFIHTLDGGITDVNTWACEMLGLGLSVCKSILDTMDGSIRFS